MDYIKEKAIEAEMNGTWCGGGGEVDMSSRNDYDGALNELEKKSQPKRSCNVYRYLWAIIGKIAKYINMDSMDVYRNAVRELARDTKGVRKIVTVHPDKLECIVENFEKYSKTRFCEINFRYPEYNKKGLLVLDCYESLRDFENWQLRKLKDIIIADAKELEIETMTPNELAELKAILGEE